MHLVAYVGDVTEGPRPYPLPPDTAQPPLEAWLRTHPNVPDRTTARRLLALYGLRLPSGVELSLAISRGVVAAPDAPVWLRDEPLRLYLSDGTVGFPELGPDRTRRRRRALVACALPGAPTDP